MNKEPTLAGVKLIQLKIFHDDRGFFTERYQENRFRELGLAGPFIQDNHSRSKPGVIRGLHYQSDPAQGKLVGAIRGKIWDVVVDVRSQSETYGRWEAFELSDENGQLLWIPPGFAHGFCVLGNEPADVMYKVDKPYSPKTEGGILFSDPSFGIPWPIKDPIVSGKDLVLQSFEEYRKKPAF